MFRVQEEALNKKLKQAELKNKKFLKKILIELKRERLETKELNMLKDSILKSIRMSLKQKRIKSTDIASLLGGIYFRTCTVPLIEIHENHLHQAVNMNLITLAKVFVNSVMFNRKHHGEKDRSQADISFLVPVMFGEQKVQGKIMFRSHSN